MANTKISALPATTASTGGDLFALVQSATNKAITFANMQASVLAANAVVNSALAQMPANTLKGNNSGSPGNAVDLTASQVGTMLGAVTALSAVGSSPQANAGSIAGATLTLQPANVSFPGVLLAADWNTFNNKQAPLSFGNLTDAGTDGITVTGGVGAVVGPGTAISQHVASATNNGYLASTDWNTFNGKQIADGHNRNTALQSQVTVAATNYYIAGSSLSLPASRSIQVGTTYTWCVTMTKSAAGTVSFPINIYFGTNGTVSDAALVSQSIGAQTAVADNMQMDVQVVFTSVGASGAMYWTINPLNKAVTATGFGCATGTTFSGTVSGINTTTAGLIMGLSFQSGTGTPTVTVPQVTSTLTNLA